MNVSVRFSMQFCLILLYGCLGNKTQRLRRLATTESPTSIESKELVKPANTTNPVNVVNQFVPSTLKVSATTKLETETCQVRKSEKALKLQVSECQRPASGRSGRKNRRVNADEETKQAILSLYGGLFYTPQTALELETSRQKAKGGPKNRVGRSTDTDHDGNICCPSLSTLEAAPSQMLNSFLQMKDIVHFENEGLYQFINKGYCVSESEQSCSGVCVPETRIIYLLVWKDPLPTNTSVIPMAFEPFDIPSFCSCKNIV